MKEKDKVKDETRKQITEDYQTNLRHSIDNLIGKFEKIPAKTKEYIDSLEENMKRAPYVLGYLEWPEKKTKKITS